MHVLHLATNRKEQAPCSWKMHAHKQDSHRVRIGLVIDDCGHPLMTERALTHFMDPVCMSASLKLSLQITGMEQALMTLSDCFGTAHQDTSPSVNYAACHSLHTLCGHTKCQTSVHGILCIACNVYCTAAVRHTLIAMRFHVSIL